MGSWSSEGRVAPRRRRRAVWLSLLVVGAVAGAAGWIVAMMPDGPQQRLPDGTVLELCGVTYGSYHEIPMPLGNWWQRTAARLRRYGGETGGMGYRNIPLGPLLYRGQAIVETGYRDSCVVWFRVHHPRPVSDGHLPLVMRSVTIDEHGCRFPGVDDGEEEHPMYESALRAGASTDTIAVAELPAFPRRQRRFQLAFYGRDGEKPLAQFNVANPVPLATAAWNAKRVTGTGKDGPTVCAVDPLRRVADHSGDGNTAARFTCGDGAHPRRSLHVTEIRLRDATGNDTQPRRVKERDGTVPFAGLCAYERTWKMTASMEPRDPLRDPPDAVWTLPSVPVPEPGDPVLLHGASIKWGSGSIWAAEIDRDENAPAVVISGGAAAPKLYISIEPRDPLLIVLQSVRDERGRELLPAPKLVRLRPNPQAEEYPIPLPPVGAGRKLTIRLGLTHVREVELLVKPPAL